MTATQIEKMRAGREASLVRLREHHAEQLAAYMRWVRSEAKAHAARQDIGDIHGRNSDAFREADAWWHEVLASMPQAPPAGAWRQS